MNFVIDTHSLLWFLINDKRLSKKANITFEMASIIYIPTIVLLELFYIMRKQKRANEFSKLLDEVKTSKQNIVVSLDLGLVGDLTKLNFPLEMHDNIIVATAKILNLPIITKDPQIQKVYKETIW